jgi:hypothetical protein
VNPHINREEIITRAMYICNPSSDHLPESLRLFYRQLENQKEICNQYLNNYLANRARREPLNEEQETRRRNLISKDVSNRILLIKNAEGLPHSPERQNQVRRLFRMNIPDLHVHIARENVNEWNS